MRLEFAVGVATFSLAVAGVATIARGPSASVIDPTMASGGSVGVASAFSVGDHVAPSRNARVHALPHAPSARRLTKLDQPIRFAPVGAANARIVVIASTDLLELDAKTGQELHRTKLGGASVIAGPILIADGTRVVLTDSEVVGVTSEGVVRFRASFSSGTTDARLAALAPTPDGGFVALRSAADMVAYDGGGRESGRVRLDAIRAGFAMAVRANGDVVVVDGEGDVNAWRPGRLPKKLGSFGRASAGGSIESPCFGGPVIDGAITPKAGERRERVLCAQYDKIYALDTASGAKSLVYGGAPVPIRSAPSVGRNGMVVATAGIGAIYGTLVGNGGSGGEIVIDLPGVSSLGTAKDAGPPSAVSPYPPPYPYGGYGPYPSVAPTARELSPSPLVDDDDAVIFGGSEGVELWVRGALYVAPSCRGGVIGFTPLGDGAVAVACGNGEITRIDEAAPSAPH